MKKRIAASFLLCVLVSCSNAAQPPPTVVPTLDVLSTAIAMEAIATPPSATLEQEASSMPEVAAGQEFSEDNSYSLRASVSPQVVGDFYEERLTELGWNQPFDNSFGVDGRNMTFRQEGSSLTITVVPAGGSVVVLWVLTLA